MCIICNTKAIAQIFGTLLGSEKVSNCQQDWVEPVCMPVCLVRVDVMLTKWAPKCLLILSRPQ